MNYEFFAHIASLIVICHLSIFSASLLPFCQFAIIYILFVDAAKLATRNGLYHTGFLPYSQVAIDGAHGNTKFSTDTHGIGSGELRGQSQQHLLGLRGGSGSGLGVVVANESAVEVHGQSGAVHDGGLVVGVGYEVGEVLVDEV